jgi:hypothetical protein
LPSITHHDRENIVLGTTTGSLLKERQLQGGPALAALTCTDANTSATIYAKTAATKHA